MKYPVSVAVLAAAIGACEAEEPPPPPHTRHLYCNMGVAFDSGSSTVSDKDKARLQQFGGNGSRCFNYVINMGRGGAYTIFANSDGEKPSEALAQSRATAVRDYLLTVGVPADRLDIEINTGHPTDSVVSIAVTMNGARIL